MTTRKKIMRPLQNVGNALNLSSIGRMKTMKQAKCILHLIEDRDWVKVGKYLDQNFKLDNTSKMSKLPEEVFKTMGQLNQLKSKGENVLHLLCSKNPPHTLVSFIAETCPTFLSQPDQNGRYPLHVALTNGAPVKVVEILLYVDRHCSAIEKPDDKGRTPLMLACQRNKLFYTASNIEVIKTLFRASPRMINHEDSTGNNAVNILLTSSKTQIDLFNEIRRSSINEWSVQSSQSF